MDKSSTVLTMILAIVVFGKTEHLWIKLGAKADKKELGFIALSGVATGASWLCYYYAVQKGVLSVVVPIDKMSILLIVLFSAIVFHEKLGKRAILGLALMVAGTFLMIFS